MTPLEMRAEARRLQAEAKQIFEKVLAEKREATAEEEGRHDSSIAKAEEMLGKAEAQEARERKAAELEKRLGESKGRASDPIPLPHNDPANTRGGRHGYSLLKALRQMANRAQGETLDGLERETSQEIANRSGKPARGFYVPWDLPASPEARSITTTTGSGAIPTLTAPTLIEILRVRALVLKMGATVFEGLEGNVNIPKQTGTGQAYWVTEGNAPTESTQTIGMVGLRPSTLAAFSTYSRRFLIQSSVSAEEFVRDDLTKIVSIELDRASINGSGVGAEPLGILQDTNVPTVALGANGGAFTWSALVNMESQVAVANADVGKLAYLFNAATRGALKRAVKDANTAAVYLWDGTAGNPTPINGYPGFVSNNVPGNLSKGTGTNLSAAIFGNWESLIVAMWGGLDVLVDPYTGAASGNVRVCLLQDANIAFRYEQSFAKVVDAVTT